MKWATQVVLLLTLSVVACAPPPLAQSELNVPSSGPGPAALVQVASSQRQAPAWTQVGGARTDSGYAFVGRGSAGTRDEAKRVAMRDLYANLSLFAGAEVKTTSIETTSSDDRGSVSEQVEVKASAAWRGVRAQQDYWRRYESPFAPTAGRVDYLVYAEVPAERIAEARHAQRARRQRAGGQRTRLVLPFSHTSTAQSGPAAEFLQEELPRHLAGSTWRVVPAPAVRQVLRGTPNLHSLRLDRVDEVFSPDEVISGLFQVHGSELSVDLVRYELSNRSATYLGRVYGSANQPRLLLQEVLRRLRGPRTHTRASQLVTSEQAARARLRAKKLLRSGRSEAALQAIYEALSLEPDSASYTWAGRILDRMGRYARATPVPAPQNLGGAQTEIRTCSPQAEQALQDAQERLRVLHERFERPASKTWWSAKTVTMSDLTRSVLRRVDAWTKCAPGTKRCVDTCVNEYDFCPDIEGDVRLEREWHHIYGSTVPRPAGVPVRLGPHASHEVLPASAGAPASQKPVRVERYEGSGHWVLISGQPRGWVRRMDLGRVKGPAVVLPAQPGSAAEAYAAALEVATRDQDRRAAAEAALDFAQAALQVDRRATALRLFRAVRGLGGRRGDLDLQSRAEFGAAQALRALQRPDEAKRGLQEALRMRLIVGDQTRLLDIYTELGALEIEQGHDAAAGQALEQSVRLARALGSAYLEVVVENNLAVLELRRGHHAFAQARFHRALDRQRDLARTQGTMAAAINLAHAQAQVGERELAQGLLNEAHELAEQSLQLRWMAEVAAHRGTQAASRRELALTELSFAALVYRQLGLGASVFRMQDALLARELEDHRTADCVAQAYNALGVPVFEAARDQRERPLLHTLPPGAVAAIDVVASYHASAAYLKSEIVPTAAPAPGRQVRGPRILRFPDPRRPPPEDRHVVLLSGSAVEEVTAATAGDAFSSRTRRPAKPIEYKKRTHFDRVLKSLTVQAEVLGALTPRDLEQAVGGWRNLRAPKVRHVAQILEGVDRHAQALNMSQLRAYALVSRAGLSWYQWRSDESYAQIQQARLLFASLSDAAGLALTDEWLAFMLDRSDRREQARVHYRRARSLYLALGDASSGQRVLEYAMPESDQ